VVIDISGYYPIPLDQLLDEIKGRVGRYIYVSTTSHYDVEEEDLVEPLREETSLMLCTEEQKQGDVKQFYNQLKAECERVLQRKKWLNKIILRPSLIVGNYDPTDRLYYWFRKVQKQDAFLLPNDGKDKISYTDVNDFAKIIT